MAVFSSSTPGEYSVNIAGTSGSLSHTTRVAVTVTAVATRAFGIFTGYSSVSIQTGNSGRTTVTITSNNGFTGTVTLSTSVSPSGPTAAMSSSRVSGGSGTSALIIDVGSSVVAGIYTVTIQATSGIIDHFKSVTVTVTGTRDVTVTASVSSLNFNSGAVGTATITVTSENDFTGTITLSVTAPTGVACSLAPTSVQSSGTATLMCSASMAGDYAVMITANGGASPYTTTVNLHVSGASPAAPVPSTILGLAPRSSILSSEGQSSPSLREQFWH